MKNKILIIGTTHIHIAELHRGAAHIMWSARVPCPETSGAYGIGPDPQSISGDEPWIDRASAVVADVSDYNIDNDEIRRKLMAVGVPLHT